MVIAKTKQHLEKGGSIKVEIEGLESQLGPDETDVDFRRNLEGRKGRKRLRDI